jgi:PAS domain S-box-containing protein/putative nucleotidyltransferase with HDIG domain
MSSVSHRGLGARALRAVDPRVSSRRRLFDAATIAVAGTIFAVTFVARGKLSNAVDADELLPLALLALRFGRRGGLAGAVVATVLVAAWELGHGDRTVTPFGYASRITGFALVGLVLGIFVDKRHRAEAKLLRYFDASFDLLATADPSGRLVRVNPAWQATLGYTVDELLARPFIEFVYPDDRQATREKFAKLLTGAQDVVRFRNRYRTAGGGIVWLEWNANASGRDGLVHATGRDITAQVEAEEQLGSNARVLEEMVAERTEELEEARAETLLRLARAGEYRDDDTFQHTERVGARSAAIAAQLGLDAKQVELIREAAPLHDIGKLAISDGILLKPGPLTAEERKEMQNHARVGARLLSGSNSPVLRMAAVIAASHHERWDGTGYPDATSGERIPLEGRIVAVADVFDALTHDRPYKQAWPLEQAIVEIRQMAGGHFDPRVAAAFLATLGRQETAASKPDALPGALIADAA